MLGKINSLFEGAAEESKEWTWTLFRVLTSAMFMTHGFGKLFGENPQPPMGGGMTSVNIADFIHLAALVAVFIMLMAYLTAHLAWFPTLNNGELAAMYFIAFLVVFTFGPGPYSADSWLSVRRQEKRKDKMDANKL